MKAAALHGFGKPLATKEVDAPRLGAHELGATVASDKLENINACSRDGTRAASKVAWCWAWRRDPTCRRLCPLNARGEEATGTLDDRRNGKIVGRIAMTP